MGLLGDHLVIVPHALCDNVPQWLGGTSCQSPFDGHGFLDCPQEIDWAGPLLHAGDVLDTWLKGWIFGIPPNSKS